MAGTVWSDEGRSWYKARPGVPVLELWPGSALRYLEMMRDVRFEDFDFSYSGYRFFFMGNGYSQIELDATADLGYYIRQYDDDAPLTTAGRRKLLSKSGTIPERKVVDWGGRNGKDANGEAQISQDVKCRKCWRCL